MSPVSALVPENLKSIKSSADFPIAEPEKQNEAEEWFLNQQISAALPPEALRIARELLKSLSNKETAEATR